VAGATDILPWAREGRAGDVHIPVLIDVAGIPELKARDVGANEARLGAATQFQRFLDDNNLAAALPVMPRCAVWFADDQIRESATIGGNLVNASPAADGTPALLAHDACVTLRSRKGGEHVSRTIPLAEFVQGPGKTAIEDGEILTGITCDVLTGYGAAFEKVGHRRSLVISTVCLAALVKLDEPGTSFEDVRLAMAGTGPVPRRLDQVEAFLKAGLISAERLERAAEMPLDLIASRTRQEYRRDVLRGFVLRALVTAARRAGADRSILTTDFEVAHA
jgi:xanthine dehydrogenase FAD-binding subunit